MLGLLCLLGVLRLLGMLSLLRWPERAHAFFLRMPLVFVSQLVRPLTTWVSSFRISVRQSFLPPTCVASKPYIPCIGCLCAACGLQHSSRRGRPLCLFVSVLPCHRLHSQMAHGGGGGALAPVIDWELCLCLLCSTNACGVLGRTGHSSGASSLVPFASCSLVGLAFAAPCLAFTCWAGEHACATPSLA